MRTNASIAAIGAALILPLAAAPPAAAEPGETVVVRGDGDGDWLFNRDSSTSTPYEFTTDKASTGTGSIYVQPITNTGGSPGSSDKFIGEQFYQGLAADLQSISYDFRIAGSGTPADANEFYLNIYTILPGSDEPFYSCRYDYVPTTGSTMQFTTAIFDRAETPQRVASRHGAECPATLAELEEGTRLTFFSISVGDTSSNDTGLAGYYDNVVVTNTDASSVAYDFEASPATKDECKNGGYADYGFENQGRCIKYVNTQR